MRDASRRLWMKAVTFRKPLLLISILVLGFVVVYEINGGGWWSRRSSGRDTVSGIPTNDEFTEPRSPSKNVDKKMSPEPQEFCTSSQFPPFPVDSSASHSPNNPGISSSSNNYPKASENKSPGSDDDHKDDNDDITIDLERKRRLVIIGSGPTALGVAQRLRELGIMRSNTQLIILEQESFPGGLAISQRDKNGFLWDMGGHVVFSHYTYFDQSLDEAVPEWNLRTRAAFAFMKGYDNRRRFIPYPVQESIDAMDGKMQRECLEGLEEITAHPREGKPVNFDEWLLKNFGEGLCNVFMRRYNRKVWTVNSTQMNAAWVGERVAVPNIEKIKQKIAAKGKIKDTSWGPNKFFRFPKYGGTGAIWKAIAERLPQGWFYYNQSVVGASLKEKTLTIVPHNDSKLQYELKYDLLITTTPLDMFLAFVSEIDSTTQYMQSLATHFVHSHTHVIGVGLRGQPPDFLADKSWIYFPDSDSPFYRVTVFSNYSNDHVPIPGKQWSLMCEAAEPKVVPNPKYWTEDNLVSETIRALVDYGYITSDQVISRYHRRLHHGYPVPFLIREELLGQIQPWLKSHDVYSRGRFGGWRYEVSNQDHSFMQGVEIAEYLMIGAAEQTYWFANKVNSQKNTGHPKLSTPTAAEYEYVVSHDGGSLEWLAPYSNHCHVYHKGEEIVPRYEFRQWDRLKNIKGEAYTYLHHIISNYNHLADVTIFLSDQLPTHQREGAAYKDIAKYVKEARSNGLSFKIPGRTLRDFESVTSRTSGLGSLADFWKAVFDRSHPARVTFSPGSCFGVSRELIRERPVKFYRKILSHLNDGHGLEFNNYMEKLWIEIFSGDA